MKVMHKVINIKIIKDDARAKVTKDDTCISVKLLYINKLKYINKIINCKLNWICYLRNLIS